MPSSCGSPYSPKMEGFVTGYVCFKLFIIIIIIIIIITILLLLLLLLLLKLSSERCWKSEVSG